MICARIIRNHVIKIPWSDVSSTERRYTYMEPQETGNVRLAML